MTNVSKYQMGLKLISISMLHLTSNIESSRQMLKETRTILVLTDSIESNTAVMAIKDVDIGVVTTEAAIDVVDPEDIESAEMKENITYNIKGT